MDSVDSRDEESPLVVSDSQSKTLQNHTRDVHILSCSFLLIFLAYGATQNLESSVNTVSFNYLNLIVWLSTIWWII